MINLGRPPCDEGVICAAAATGGCADRAKPWVLAATILGSSMAFIDGSVVNVALPHIQSDLNMSVQGAQWVVNGYMLMLGALVLLGGSAGDHFGRRRVFALGAAIFTAASISCGLAPNATVLVAARVLQGIGGALLVPGSLALISAAFPAEERGKAVGTWSGFSAVATALGRYSEAGSSIRCRGARSSSLICRLLWSRSLSRLGTCRRGAIGPKIRPLTGWAASW